MPIPKQKKDSKLIDEQNHLCEHTSCCKNGLVILAIITVLGFAGMAILLLNQRPNNPTSNDSNVAITSNDAPPSLNIETQPPLNIETPLGVRTPVPASYPQISFMDWADFSMEYPTGWHAMAQTFNRSETARGSEVLTMNPTYILIHEGMQWQPFFLRISRLKMRGAETPDRILEEARDLYIDLKEAVVELEPGLVMHKLSGERKLDGVGIVPETNYYLLAQLEYETAIYLAEPQTIMLLEPYTDYETVIEKVESILSTIRLYKY